MNPAGLVEGLGAAKGTDRFARAGALLTMGLDVIPALSVVLFLCALDPSDLSGQAPRAQDDAGLRWTESAAASPMTISGLVIDERTGNAVSHPLVSIDGTSVGVVGDSTGRFSLELPQPGEVILRAGRIGYEPVVDTILVGPDSGILAQVNLRAEPIRVCERLGCPDCPTAGVQVEVLAFDTGSAPSRPVVVRVESGGRTDSTTASFPVDNKYGRSIVFAGGPLETDGPFSVEVQSDGYATWRAEDVWLEHRNCAWSPLLHAWLLPL